MVDNFHGVQMLWIKYKPTKSSKLPEPQKFKLKNHQLCGICVHTYVYATYICIYKNTLKKYEFKRGSRDH